jgi:prolyl-tRNA editing enzyme YbaK/EbsC (Cys-tRNA(Pro) deacylase)
MQTGGRFAAATEDLTRVLDEAGPRYELLQHARTESAVAEAEALGFASADVAKTLVVTTPEGVGFANSF